MYLYSPSHKKKTRNCQPATRTGTPDKLVRCAVLQYDLCFLTIYSTDSFACTYFFVCVCCDGEESIK